MPRSRESVGLPVLSDPEAPLYIGDQVRLEADLRTVSRRRLAEEITGGLFWPGKMDCPAWGISATRCRVGSVLARKEGTVCHDCYAMKGTFQFGANRRKLERAYEGLMDARNLWTPSMVFLIRWYAAERFRWFHSGDLQGINHLRNIIRICLETPDVLHWLPTRESKVVLACKDAIPPNLAIRASATGIGGEPPRWWPLTSTVVMDGAEGVCPSSLEGGNCSDHGCTACWDREVENVAYRLH